MPLEPITHYEEPAYPTLDAAPEARRAFLRSIGLAAIAAAIGPVSACGRIGGVVGGITANSSNERIANTGDNGPQIPTAGVPPPPKWPGPKGALIGGGPIDVTYADGERGWVAVAAVFDPMDVELEDRLINAEEDIRELVAKRLSREKRIDMRRVAQRDVVEDELLVALRKLVKSDRIASVTIAELTEDAVRGPARRAARPAAPEPGSAAAPAPAPPAASAPAAAPPRRRLQRAGSGCPLHPEGCEASGKPGN